MSRTPARRGRRGLPAPGVPAPADRRFRRSQQRVSRTRLWQALWRPGKWVLVAIAAGAAATTAARVVMESSWLRVSRVAVHGNVRLSATEVETLLAGVRGENILRVDFDRYRRRLLGSPWVADVSLWRQLPSTIDVRVTERRPIAIARLGADLYLVDAAGVVIDAYDARFREFDLPIVDGLVAPSGDGPAADPDRARLAAAVLDALAPRADLRRRLSQVDVSDAHDAVVMFDADPAWLHLGDTNFLDRLDAYLELAPTLRDRFQAIDSVDLRFGERMYVRGQRQQASTIAADRR